MRHLPSYYLSPSTVANPAMVHRTLRSVSRSTPLKSDLWNFPPIFPFALGDAAMLHRYVDTLFTIIIYVDAHRT
jgi:hypothetical protein